MENIPETLDISNQKLKKLNKFTSQESQNTINLILDNNELQRLENIDSFIKLQKLSAIKNQLLRMYGVCRLHSLQYLNLSYNGILTIEGLKDLVNLKWLCLAGNNIKTIEHLTTNISIEHLDLSENCISHISDLSHIKNLMELFLHNNKINHLRQCERYLPTSLKSLTLANNNIEDLNEISQLVHLINLTSISIANNPCIKMTNNAIGFDYRPFVINWCLNIKTIDGYVVDAIESLRAEWLYSQGRGRNFRVGDQKELIQYLSSVCPLTGETLETEEDKKLRLILSKAQHHQQQLREQSTNSEISLIPSPYSKKKMYNSRNSPKLSSSRLSNRSKSPDKMSSSYYGSTISNDNSSIMSQSLDPTLLRNSINGIDKSLELNNDLINSPLQALTKMVPVPESLMSPDYRPSTIIGKNNSSNNTVIINDDNKINNTTKIQKKNQKTTTTTTTTTCKNKINLSETYKKCNSSSPARQKKCSNISKTKSIMRNSPATSDEDLEINISKLQTIQQRVEEKKLQKDNEININKLEKSAIIIQKIWRGYYTRNLNKKVQQIFRIIQTQRANQYIHKLTNDMENTKAALESERKIQMLQTEAISALWKQMSSLQPTSNGQCNSQIPTLNSENSEIVRELSKTCTVLQNQIQELQNSMQEIVKVMSTFSRTTLNCEKTRDIGIATQTEIIAVHTPQGDDAKLFPFQKPLLQQQQQQQQLRPSSLPLDNLPKKKNNITNEIELRQYAGSLVDEVIRCVSETQDNLMMNEEHIESDSKALIDN